MSGYIDPQEPTRNARISVGVTSVVICEPRTGDIATNGRKVIWFRNDSSDPTMVITVNMGFNAPAAGYGVILRQYESYMESRSEYFQPFNGTITAICAVAGGTLAVFER